MATKPNETYKWGENATHEQVAAYEDTGWPSDAIPPKRTQFNWYQNLVGRWLGWAEDAVDEIVDRVLDAWFVEVAGLQNVPNKTGIYKHELNHRFYLVHGDHMATVGFFQPYFTASYYTWDGSQWVEGGLGAFTRANTRSGILQESEANYVTPKGLVDYFSAIGDIAYTTSTTPHASGVYRLGYTGIAVVTGDHMTAIYNAKEGEATIEAFTWSNGAWT